MGFWKIVDLFYFHCHHLVLYKIKMNRHGTQLKPSISKYQGKLLPIRKSTLYRRHSCVRKELTRQWLQLELLSKPHAKITGNIVDIDLTDLWVKETIGEQFYLQFIANHPGVNTVDQVQKVQRQYMYDIWSEDDDDDLTYDEFINSGYVTPLYNPDNPLIDLLRDPTLRQIGVYVTYHIRNAWHIFSVLVEKDGNTLVNVTVMDTYMFPMVYDDIDQSQWQIAYKEKVRFYLAIQLLHLADGSANTLDQLMAVTQYVTSDIIDEPANLQEEESEGFCQHWDTFFLYMTMVRGVDPTRLFEKLARLYPTPRKRLIQNFANDMAAQAQVKPFVGDLFPSSVPIQMSTAMGISSVPFV